MKHRPLLTGLLAATMTLFLLPSVHAGKHDRRIGKPALRAKMEAMILRNVEFEEVQVQDVFRYLKQQSKALDPEGKGVNFFFKVPKKSLTHKVTISFSKMPMDRLVEYLCNGSDLSCSFEEHAVVIGKKIRRPAAKKS